MFLVLDSDESNFLHHVLITGVADIEQSRLQHCLHVFDVPLNIGKSIELGTVTFKSLTDGLLLLPQRFLLSVVLFVIKHSGEVDLCQPPHLLLYRRELLVCWTEDGLKLDLLPLQTGKVLLYRLPC
ncbi:hypothetical protein SA87_04525 [Hydrogenibacillus schlegelii]|uniref:Uncharacterized protein n=1 Tax=Hydrogenibacillus schlegelii TaxID=1484 RepID=A0A179IQA4_HYDSH|nr:hypothetical protein SA87_04525 [Hydrogenibacillus schlegelii]